MAACLLFIGSTTTDYSVVTKPGSNERLMLCVKYGKLKQIEYWGHSNALGNKFKPKMNCFHKIEYFILLEWCNCGRLLGALQKKIVLQVRWFSSFFFFFFFFQPTATRGKKTVVYSPFVASSVQSRVVLVASLADELVSFWSFIVVTSNAAVYDANVINNYKRKAW